MLEQRVTDSLPFSESEFGAAIRHRVRFARPGHYRKADLRRARELSPANLPRHRSNRIGIAIENTHLVADAPKIDQAAVAQPGALRHWSPVHTDGLRFLPRFSLGYTPEAVTYYDRYSRDNNIDKAKQLRNEMLQ
jgi:hypothetical protein